MNEYQRQAYLSALGVENYMPKWCLVGAPQSIACVLPYCSIFEAPVNSITSTAEKLFDQLNTSVGATPLPTGPLVVADVLRELAGPKRSISSENNNASLIQAASVEVSEPFALSIWRPKQGLLIVDSRNARQALPTELLLSNILRAVFGGTLVTGQEDVLRWPLVENTAVSRTENDARNALQVWLEVEIEQRPVNHMLLFGAKAAQHFLPQDVSYSEHLWCWSSESSGNLQKLVAPSLVELLQQPLLKHNLWQSLACLRAPV